jgi:chemotaxis protein CheZ
MSTGLVQEAEDLEALFDSIAEARRVESAAAPAAVTTSGTSAQSGAAAELVENDAYNIFERIGSLTRNLHDALKALGYDKQVEQAVGVLPDARARLDYIAKLTGQAADTALNKSEEGVSIQQKVLKDATELGGQWDAVFDGTLGVDAFRAHAEKTRQFLKQLPQQASATNGLFSDIILAQDFHDLTGQVVNRIVSVAENLEAQLVKLLLDSTPPDRRSTMESEWMNGPVIDTKGRDDVVNSQAQVDDLLASLGF